MKKILFLFLFSTVSALLAFAGDDDRYYHARWEASFTAGLNSDGYEFDIGAVWFPVRYLGIKAAIGFAGELHEVSDWGIYDWGIYDDEYYYDDYDDDYASRFRFMPSVELRSPTLINWRSQGGQVYIFANPGLCMSPGASGSKGAEWLNWQVRAGVTLAVDQIAFTLGYGISDFNLYSGRPYSHNGLPDEDFRTTHTGFISFAYKF